MSVVDRLREEFKSPAPARAQLPRRTIGGGYTVLTASENAAWRPPSSPSAIAEGHCCPVDTCTVWVSRGMVGCRDHFLTIPLAERRLLVEAFRRREQDPETFALAWALAEQLMRGAA